MQIKNNLNIKYILIIIVLFFSVQSCKLLKPSQVKQAEKVERQKIKEAEKAYELLKDEHLNRQSVLAKKRMENTKQRSEYLNLSKKRPTFWQRIFKKRDKKRKK